MKSPTTGWAIGIALAAVLGLLAGLLAWGLWPNNPAASTNTSTQGANPSTTSSAAATPSATPPQLLTPDGLTGFLAQMRTKFGDTLGYQLDIDPDGATLYRADSANPHGTAQWLYDNTTGWMDAGASSIPSDTVNSGPTVVGDLSRFNVPAVLGVLPGAPQTLHVTNPTSTSLVINSTKHGGLALQIHVVGQPGSGGYMNLAADGTVGRIVTADS